MPGEVVIPSVVGIMAISLPSLHLMFESLQSTKPWLDDRDIIDLSCRNETELEHGKLGDEAGLAFGLFANDGMVLPHPPITRAIRIVSKALELKGYKV